MHAGSPPLNSVARRTRSQWEMFYRNWHNEVKKEEANEGGVGHNEGSNSENNEISRKRGAKRTRESVDEGLGSEISGNNADKMGSVSGGLRGKKKSVKKIDSVDDQISGSCSKSGPISNVGCDASKKCMFSYVDETVQGRGRPQIAPSNKGMHVSIDESVDLGKSGLFVDSEDSEKSMDLESSVAADSNSDDSGMLESNSSSEEENDNSDEDFKVNISSTSGDSEDSSFCNDFSQEGDDDACCDGSPSKMKMDPEEKDQTVVHQEEKCINVGKNKVINEERDSELAGLKRNYVPYSDYGCMDDSQEVGDGSDNMKSSKKENDDLNKSSLKKRKFPGVQNLVDNCMGKEACEGIPFKKKMHRTKNLESIKMLINSIEKEAHEPMEKHKSVDIDAMNPKSLPLKFRFEDEEPSPPEKSEWEKEIDSLFCDLDMGLRESEFGCKNSSTNNDDDDIIPQDVDCTQAASCGRGEHDPVLDDQIGIKCRYCCAVILEIEDILPPFYTPPPGRQDRKYFYESHSCIFDQNQFQDSPSGNPSSSSNHAGDTVWDLIRGTKSKLYHHQREGFEFMWRNIAGDIFIEKLRRPLSEDGKGCIISHAPGTGKTRLTIVFLQSFMKLYPTCRPVIIAPRGMLLTWEDEFRKWNVAIPFHNLNSLELSAEENAVSPEIISQVGSHRRSQEYIRLVKFSSWVKGSSVLGLSYQLFEKLVGEHRRKREHDRIWKLLLKLPDLLVLDEGHTPRNHQSRMWKALTKVATNRRIILSGTPFQNNFRELYNTLCLVNPKLMDQIDKIRQSCKKGWQEINGTRGKWTSSSKSIDKTMDNESTKLRTMIDPFVHVHKGSILQESLPGLRDSLVFLRPTELQKSLLEIASKAKPFFHEVCLVSLISVHPSLVAKEEMFSAYKSEVQRIESTIDAGVKTKFVTKLIWLADALGERVLVFSTFINPLIFIKQQLEHHFSWKEGREVLYMDGQLEENQRQYSICSFNDFSSEAKVLLASTRACSEGINLIGASRVVLLDTAWNPSVERQAISRAYRLGQKKVVHVYHLITSGTIEFRKYALQAQKDRISQLIFSPTDWPPTCDSETSNIVAEDKVFEALVEDKSFSHIFEKIIHQPKASDLIETSDFVDHKW